MSPSEIDRQLFFFINQGLRNPFFDLLMPFVTTRTVLVFLPFAVLLCFEKKKAAVIAILAGLGALALADGTGHLIKDLVMRRRPCSALDNVHLLVGCGGAYSMPSNHATNAFAVAMTIWFSLGGRTRHFFVAVAALIGFSRISVGVHYPSDVLAGAVVGTLSAAAVAALVRHLERRYGRPASAGP